MSPKNVDRKNLTITEAAEKLADDHAVQVEEPATNETGVTIIVTKAFGPKGDNLVGISEATFDSYPAITIGVRANGKEGLVHLSPIHGDSRKSGFTNIPVGTKCELFCPVSKELLDEVGEVDGEHEAHYYALYLTPKLSNGSLVAISDVWGHYHSRIIDGFDLISQWESTHAELGDSSDD